MLHIKPSKWIYIVSNNNTKVSKGYFGYNICPIPFRIVRLSPKLSPETHVISILTDISHKRNHMSWNVVMRMNIGNHLIQPFLIL